MLPQAPPPKKKRKEKEKKNDEINIPLPPTRTVDRLQNYLKFSSKYTLKGRSDLNTRANRGKNVSILVSMSLSPINLKC